MSEVRIVKAETSDPGDLIDVLRQALDEAGTTEDAEVFIANIEKPVDNFDKQFAARIGVRRSLLDQLKLAAVFMRYNLWGPLYGVWLKNDFCSLRNVLKVVGRSPPSNSGSSVQFYSMNTQYFREFPEFTVEKTQEALEELYWHIKPSETSEMKQMLHRLAIQVEALVDSGSRSAAEPKEKEVKEKEKEKEPKPEVKQPEVKQKKRQSGADTATTATTAATTAATYAPWAGPGLPVASSHDASVQQPATESRPAVSFAAPAQYQSYYAPLYGATETAPSASPRVSRGGSKQQ